MFIADLTELEMTDLLESCNELIDRNKWTKLREEVFTEGLQIDELQDENDKLSEDNEELQYEKDELERDCNKALDYLNEGEIEKAKKILSEI